MRILHRSAALWLVLGVAVTGCGPSSPPREGTSLKSNFKDTQADQVVLRMDGVV